MRKYKYYTYTNETGAIVTVCEGQFAQRRVKGYAKCDPNDTYDEELGKKIAKLRCDYKIAQKRFANACSRCDDSYVLDCYANDVRHSAEEYYNRAVEELDALAEEMIEIHLKVNED